MSRQARAMDLRMDPIYTEEGWENSVQDQGSTGILYPAWARASHAEGR